MAFPNYYNKLTPTSEVTSTREQCIENLLLGAFLGESITELRRLEKDGFLSKASSKIRVLVVTTDTVARPLLLNTSQFNGECGCNFCLHPLDRVSKGKGGTREYPKPYPDDKDPTNYPLRSKEQHLIDLEFVLRTGKPRNGIMGQTPLMNLPDLEFVKAFVPEYRHADCQGGCTFKELNVWTQFIAI
jgi:hypothetical protein